MAKRREIRNSTAEFLIFQIEGKEQGIDVYYKDKTVWFTQKAMGMLFDCTADNIRVDVKVTGMSTARFSFTTSMQLSA